MSVANIGGIVNLIQNLVGLNAAAGGAFVGANARQQQGVADFPWAVQAILARTDLPSSLSAKVLVPNANSASVNVITAALTGQLIGCVVDSNDVADTWVQIFNTAAAGVTLGTTVERYDLAVTLGTMQAFTFPGAPAFNTAMSWDATTGPHGATRSTAGKVTVMFVYVA